MLVTNIRRSAKGLLADIKASAIYLLVRCCRERRCWSTTAVWAPWRRESRRAFHTSVSYPTATINSTAAGALSKWGCGKGAFLQSRYRGGPRGSRDREYSRGWHISPAARRVCVAHRFRRCGLALSLQIDLSGNWRLETYQRRAAARPMAPVLFAFGFAPSDRACKGRTGRRAPGSFRCRTWKRDHAVHHDGSSDRSIQRIVFRPPSHSFSTRGCVRMIPAKLQAHSPDPARVRHRSPKPAPCLSKARGCGAEAACAWLLDGECRLGRSNRRRRVFASAGGDSAGGGKTRNQFACHASAPVFCALTAGGGDACPAACTCAGSGKNRPTVLSWAAHRYESLANAQQSAIAQR